MVSIIRWSVRPPWGETEAITTLEVLIGYWS